MKLLFLSLFLSCNTLAIEAVNIKVADGASAQCNSKADIYNGKFGAYRPVLKDFESSTSGIHFNLELSTIKCLSVSEDFKFILIKPFDTFSYESLNFNGELIKIKAEPVDGRVIFYRDGKYKIISESKIINSEVQNFDINILYDDLFTPSEITKLENGEEVAGNLDYRLQRSIRINNEEVPSSINYGAFRIKFKARLNFEKQLFFEIL